MDTLFTPQNIMFILGLLGIMFGVYHYFRNPQIDGDKKDALLAQQVQWQIEGTERRFLEIQNSIKSAFELASNHTHTVEVKVEKLENTISGLTLSVSKMGTIIEERIPKK